MEVYYEKVICEEETKMEDVKAVQTRSQGPSENGSCSSYCVGNLQYTKALLIFNSQFSYGQSSAVSPSLM
jgi:hypothetical protein